MANNDIEMDDVAQWPSQIESYFVHLLHEEAKKGLQTNTLDRNTWKTIDNAIFSKFGKRFTTTKLKTKYTRLRKNHREFSKLLEHTGMGWDSMTNTVTADEETWKTYIKRNPSASRFKKKGCSHYEILGEIFNSTTATGQMYFASTMNPPDSSEERNLEREFIHTGAHVEQPEFDDETQHDANGSGRRRAIEPLVDERTRRSTKVTTKQANVDTCLMALTKSLNEKAEYIASKRSRVETSINSPEEYSIKDCMAKLSQISGIPSDVFAKTAREFVSVDIRQLFMTMPDDHMDSFLGLG